VVTAIIDKMKKKPFYSYPEEYVDINGIKMCCEESENKRYCLEIPLKNRNQDNGIVVILKNPSRAKAKEADKTISTVIRYISKKEELKDIGKIVILNLMPVYETYSDKLTEDNIDDKNMEYIVHYTRKYKKTIIAWGNKPKNFRAEKYKELCDIVLKILKDNEVFRVGEISEKGNPKHGQVWRYVKEEDVLRLFN